MTMAATHPLAARPAYSDHARTTLAALDARLDAVHAHVLASRPWAVLVGADSDPRLVRAFLGEVMHAVHQYQPLTTEAGFTMLGRLPKHEEKLLTSLLLHKAEEATHAAWARRDMALLGTAARRADEAMSPTTFAVAAVWHLLAQQEEPFGYLGAEYLFEALTLRVAAAAMQAASRAAIPASSIGFIVDHATEDVKHTNLLTHWILDIVTRYPASAASMLRAFDRFAAVYPLPVWSEAFQRALASTGGRGD